MLELRGGVILIWPAHTYSLSFPPSAFPAHEYSYLPILCIYKNFTRCRFCNCFYAFTSAHHFPICISTQESRRTQSLRTWKLINAKPQFQNLPLSLLAQPTGSTTLLSQYNIILLQIMLFQEESLFGTILYRGINTQNLYEKYVINSYKLQKAMLVT